MVNLYCIHQSVIVLELHLCIFLNFLDIVMRLLASSLSKLKLENVRFSSSMFGSQFNSSTDNQPSNRTCKNILHLNVSHSSKSLVAQGASIFLSKLNFQHKVQEVNMWTEGVKTQYSLEHAKAKMNILQETASDEDVQFFDPVLKAAQNINTVDLVLISTPMWNYSVPYPLKQYIDTIVQPGINFSDELQTGLEHLRGRHLVVFSSAGALYNEKSEIKDHLNPYLSQVFRLMGFDKQKIIFIQERFSPGIYGMELTISSTKQQTTSKYLR